MHNALPPLPPNAPKVGEVYTHYKGNLYKVVGLALHSTEEWVVVYQAMYDNPAAELFTRPLAEWREVVEWQGAHVERFIRQS
ncbi:MAG: DUF1653 domain-containing protein [Candidatus Pacebacteria bacterium]|nr:DUF1653 domain-containing protein [Candidatus Paceibacterota bacterium]